MKKKLDDWLISVGLDKKLTAQFTLIGDRIWVTYYLTNWQDKRYRDPVLKDEAAKRILKLPADRFPMEAFSARPQAW